MDFLCKKSWKILEIFQNFSKNMSFYAKFDEKVVKFLQNYARITKIFQKITQKAAPYTEILHNFSKNCIKMYNFLILKI